MILYWDTSAFAALILEDGGWRAIDRWIEANNSPSALSDFAWGEFVSAAAMRVRAGRLDHAGGRLTLAGAERVIHDWLRPRMSSDDLDDATRLVARFDLRLRLPDAIHVAIARRIGALLVTTDYRQRDAARAIGVPVHDPLEDHA